MKDKVKCPHYSERIEMINTTGVSWCVECFFDDICKNGVLEVELAEQPKISDSKLTPEESEFKQILMELTDNCGCICHVGMGVKTTCEHCAKPAEQPCTNSIEKYVDKCRECKINPDCKWHSYYPDELSPKCNFLDCDFGFGLAGSGWCGIGGNCWDKNCSKFTREFSRQPKAADKIRALFNQEIPKLKAELAGKLKKIVYAGEINGYLLPVPIVNPDNIINLINELERE